ncbi:MAG: glycoside hydrolase family 9 protein, partial [Ignavibacteriaceae bacterium]|nr:glycoside hydrolase family 9 protein [Ignavibacteriaceae bacterium]
MKNLKTIILFLLACTFSINCFALPPNSVYIRANQVGYLPGELKSAIIFSESPLQINEFKVLSFPDNKIVFSGFLTDSVSSFDKFKFCRSADFTKLNKSGKYFLRYNGFDSYPFTIGSDVYKGVADSLLMFFQVQRCGPTNPFLHKVCHLQDATEVVGYSTNKQVDVTGGWHDAGDYIKFLSTTAYATYMMLFAYEFDNNKFSFDGNKNSVPDILEEARVGLDWMLRCNFKDHLLITQVQNMQDHNEGFRLPSDDSLTYNRPAYVGMGKNQAGLFTAAMALASRIWRSKFHDYEFAGKCLKAAEVVYNKRNQMPKLDTVQSGMYQDVSYLGKLALGAVELFMTKKDRRYLVDAEIYADSAKSDYWWSWG